MTLNYKQDQTLVLTCLAEGQRTLRKWERKAKVAAHKARERRVNDDLWSTKRENLYKARMESRKFIRINHLALAFHKGQEYTDVEQGVREGNEPDAYQIFVCLSMTDRATVADIQEWLGQEAV